MNYYAVNYSYNDLQHHGVLGMKWGVRKERESQGRKNRASATMDGVYQNKANKHLSKLESSRTRIGKNYHNARALNYDIRARQARTQANSKTLMGKFVSSQYGVDNSKATADYYNRKSQYAKTRLGKTINKSSAYNANASAKMFEKISQTKGIKNKGKVYVDDYIYGNRKTWSGRNVTQGQYFIENMLGISNIKDFVYYKGNK